MSSDQENQGEAIYSDDSDFQNRESYMTARGSKIVEGSVNKDPFQAALHQQQSSIPEHNLYLKHQKVEGQSQITADFTTEASTIQVRNTYTDQSQRQVDNNISAAKSAISDLEVGEYHQLGEGLKLSENNDLLESIKRDNYFKVNQNKSNLNDESQDLVLLPKNQNFEERREDEIQIVQINKDIFQLKENQQNVEVNENDEVNEGSQFEDVEEQIVNKQQKDAKEEVEGHARQQQIIKEVQYAVIQNQIRQDQSQNINEEKQVSLDIGTVIQGNINQETEQKITQSNIVHKQQIEYTIQKQPISQLPIQVQIKHEEIIIQGQVHEENASEVVITQNQHGTAEIFVQEDKQKVELTIPEVEVNLELKQKQEQINHSIRESDQHQQFHQPQHVHLEQTQKIQNAQISSEKENQIEGAQEVVQTQKIEKTEKEHGNTEEQNVIKDLSHHIQEQKQIALVQEQEHFQIPIESTKHESQHFGEIHQDQKIPEVIKNETNQRAVEAIIQQETISTFADHSPEQSNNIIEHIQFKQEVSERRLDKEQYNKNQVNIKENIQIVEQIIRLDSHHQIHQQHEPIADTQNEVHPAKGQIKFQQNHEIAISAEAHFEEQKIYVQNVKQSQVEPRKQEKQLVEQRTVQIVLQSQVQSKPELKVSQQLKNEPHFQSNVEGQKEIMGHEGFSQQVSKKQQVILQKPIILSYPQKQQTSIVKINVQNYHQQTGFGEQRQSIRKYLGKDINVDNAEKPIVQHEIVDHQSKIQVLQQLPQKLCEVEKGNEVAQPVVEKISAEQNQQLYSVMKQAVEEMISALPEKVYQVDNNEVSSQILHLKPVPNISGQNLGEQNQVQRNVFVSQKPEVIEQQISSHPIEIEQTLDNNKITKKGHDSSVLKKPLPNISVPRQSPPKKEQAIAKSQSCKCTIM